jgi:hypothetical protein
LSDLLPQSCKGIFHRFDRIDRTIPGPGADLAGDNNSVKIKIRESDRDEVILEIDEFVWLKYYLNFAELRA